MDMYDFVYLLRSNKYVSNKYILDRNPRLSSYTIHVTHSDYISLLLVCGDFPLTSKTGGCWNLLESTPARISLIKSSHKWTQMLFIISNSKLEIWLCSQPRIDLNSQSKFYDVLTRPYKYLSNKLSTHYTKQHSLKKIYMLVSPGFTPLWRMQFHRRFCRRWRLTSPSTRTQPCNILRLSLLRTCV